MVVAELFATLGLLPDEKSWKEGHDLIQGLAHAIEAYFSIEAIKGVVEMFEAVAEAADHAAKESMRTGIAIQALQELGHAAESSDSSLASLESGLSKLEKGMEKAAKTSKGPVVDALHKLKLSLSSFKGLSAEEQFALIADKIAAMPDGLEKATIATQLFGGAGRSLIPLLDAGSEGIAEMRHEAHELGIVVDEQTAKAFSEFNDQTARVHKSLAGIKTQIAEALLPTFKGLVDSFYEWIRANREWIEEGVEAAVNGLISVFKTLAHVVEDVADFLKKHKEILVGALALVAGWLGIIAVQAAIAGVAMLISFAPVIAAIAVLTVVIKEMWDAFGGGEYTTEEVMRALRQLAEDFSEWLQDLPDKIDGYMKAAGDAITGAFKAAWDAVVAASKEAWEAIKNTIKEAWEAIKDIPIVGHVIRGGAFVVRHLNSGPGVTDQIIVAQKAMDMMSSGTIPVPAQGFAPGTIINGGDLHLIVQGATLTPEELRDTVAGHVREAQTDALRAAYTNMGGKKS